MYKPNLRLVLCETLPQTLKTFHPAIGWSLDLIRWEYSISRVVWNHGATTYHLNRVRYTNAIRDPWDNCQYGQADSERVAQDLGIDWNSAKETVEELTRRPLSEPTSKDVATTPPDELHYRGNGLY